MSNNLSRDIDKTKRLENVLYQTFGKRKANGIKERCLERAFKEAGYSGSDFSIEIGDAIRRRYNSILSQILNPLLDSKYYGLIIKK